MQNVYESLGVLVTPLVSAAYGGQRRDGLEVLDRLPAETDLLHVELGAGHSTAFWAAVEAQRRGHRLLVTVHDRIIVHNAYPLPYGISQRLGLAAAIGQRAGMAVTGRLLVPRLVRPLRPYRASLMKADPAADIWLPHPRMTDPGSARAPGLAGSSVVRMGLVGSWSPAKGLRELIEAWKLIGDKQGVSLLVTGSSNDRYARVVSARLRELDDVEVAEVLADNAAVDEVLRGLDLLLLPYLRNWSGSASGIAQRAAELGIPMIASDLPALRSQLGDSGAVWIEPGSARSLADAIIRTVRDPGPAVAAASAASRCVMLTEAMLPELLEAAIAQSLSG